MQFMTDDDKKIIVSPAPVVDFGCDILDDDGNVVGDLTPDLVAGSVSHQNYADVHGTCELTVTRELDWPNVWLRPWQSVTSGKKTARFNQGVYRPAIPETPLGDVPLTWQVTCADKLSLLQRGMRDTNVSAVGSSVLAEVQRAITESGVPGAVLVDTTDADVVLDRDMVWVLDIESPGSFLRWVNDLLDATAYRGLYADEDGNFRVDKYRAPAVRKAEFSLDLTDPSTDITEVVRTARTDGWSPFNWWRFVRANMAVEPVDGAGVYTVDRSSSGMVFPKFASLDVASHAQLVAQGDRIVDTDLRLSKTVDITTGPLPSLGHADVVSYNDPQYGPQAEVSVRSWSIDLATGATDITLEVPRG